MTSFSILLLKFPSVIFTHIIHSTDPDALVCLALCSRRMHYAVNREIRRIPKSLQFVVVADVYQLVVFKNRQKDYEVLFATSTKSYYGHDNLTTVKIRGQTVLAKMDNGTLLTFWDDPVLGCKLVREFVSDLFNLNIAVIIFNRTSTWFHEWMNSLQKPVPMAVTYEERMSAEDYQFLMSMCKAEKLFVLAIAPVEFNPLETFQPLPLLQINHGSWMRTEHLLRMDCVKFFAKETNFDSSHLNILLKHWVAGGFERLRVLRVDTQLPYAFRTIFHELTSKTTRVQHERQYYISADCVCKLKAGTIDITRDDGRVASVRLSNIDMTFLVWPDFSSE